MLAFPPDSRPKFFKDITLGNKLGIICPEPTAYLLVEVICFFDKLVDLGACDDVCHVIIKSISLSAADIEITGEF